MDNSEFVSALRQLADWYEAHPGMKEPSIGTLNIWVSTKEEFAEQARIFGTAEKEVDEDFFMLRKRFGEITVELNARRNEVCERVRVGSRVVPEQVLPAREAEVIPEHEEDVFEWKCPESVLKGATK